MIINIHTSISGCLTIFKYETGRVRLPFGVFLLHLETEISLELLTYRLRFLTPTLKHTDRRLNRLQKSIHPVLFESASPHRDHGNTSTAAVQS